MIVKIYLKGEKRARIKCCLKDLHHKYKERDKLKVKDIPYESKHKKEDMAIRILDKVDF